MPGVTYKHDCAECVYEGTFPNEKGVNLDFYTCQGSVIARFGDEGHNYISAPATQLLSIRRLRDSLGATDNKMIEIAEELEKRNEPTG